VIITRSVLVGLALILSACLPREAVVPQETTPTRVNGASLLGTDSPTPPLPTALHATGAPTAGPPSATPLPTPTVTPHPIAALTADEAYRLANFLDPAPGCALPCWNGLIPGVSAPAEIPAFFARVGVDIDGFPPYRRPDGLCLFSASFTAFPHGSADPPIVSVAWPCEGPTVAGISIIWPRPPDFVTFSGLADELGIPETILASFTAYEGPKYAILLDFEQQPTGIVLSGVPRCPETGACEFCRANFTEARTDVTLYSETLLPIVSYGYRMEDWRDWPGALGIPVEQLFALLLEGKCVALPEP
jgi:hypothetical protein